MSKYIAQKKAKELSENLDIQYPIDLESLCKLFNIKIHRKKLNKEGYFLICDGKKYIFLSDAIEYPKTRFVLAHEMGHYFLHPGDVLQICNGIKETFNANEIIDETEVEANSFASDLLLPTKEILKILPTNRIDLNFLLKVAKKYEVSLSAVAIKCIENSKSESEILICYEKNIARWFVCANKEITWNDIPSSPPYLSKIWSADVPSGAITKQTLSEGTWEMFQGEVIEEVINIFHQTKLVLISGYYIHNDEIEY